MANAVFRTATGGIELGTAGFALPGDNAGFCSAILAKAAQPPVLRLESLTYILPAQGQEGAEAGVQPPVVVNLLMQLRAYYDQSNTFLRAHTALETQLTAQLKQVLAQTHGAVRTQAREIERAIRGSLLKDGELRRALDSLEREVKKNENSPVKPAVPLYKSIRTDAGTSIKRELAASVQSPSQRPVLGTEARAAAAPEPGEMARPGASWAREEPLIARRLPSEPETGGMPQENAGQAEPSASARPKKEKKRGRRRAQDAGQDVSAEKIASRREENERSARARPPAEPWRKEDADWNDSSIRRAASDERRGAVPPQTDGQSAPFERQRRREGISGSVRPPAAGPAGENGEKDGAAVILPPALASAALQYLTVPADDAGRKDDAGAPGAEKAGRYSFPARTIGQSPVAARFSGGPGLRRREQQTQNQWNPDITRPMGGRWLQGLTESTAYTADWARRQSGGIRLLASGQWARRTLWREAAAPGGVRMIYRGMPDSAGRPLHKAAGQALLPLYRQPYELHRGDGSHIHDWHWPARPAPKGRQRLGRFAAPYDTAALQKARKRYDTAMPHDGLLPRGIDSLLQAGESRRIAEDAFDDMVGRAGLAPGEGMEAFLRRLSLLAAPLPGARAPQRGAAVQAPGAETVYRAPQTQGDAVRHMAFAPLGDGAHPAVSTLSEERAASRPLSVGHAAVSGLAWLIGAAAQPLFGAATPVSAYTPGARQFSGPNALPGWANLQCLRPLQGINRGRLNRIQTASARHIGSTAAAAKTSRETETLVQVLQDGSRYRASDGWADPVTEEGGPSSFSHTEGASDTRLPSRVGADGLTGYLAGHLGQTSTVRFPQADWPEGRAGQADVPQRRTTWRASQLAGAVIHRAARRPGENPSGSAQVIRFTHSAGSVRLPGETTYVPAQPEGAASQSAGQRISRFAGAVIHRAAARRPGGFFRLAPPAVTAGGRALGADTGLLHSGYSRTEYPGTAADSQKAAQPERRVSRFTESVIRRAPLRRPGEIPAAPAEIIRFAQPAGPVYTAGETERIPERPEGAAGMVYRSPVPPPAAKGGAQEESGEDVLRRQLAAPPRPASAGTPPDSGAPASYGASAAAPAELSPEQERRLAGQVLDEINYNRLTEEILVRVERRLRAERRKFGL